MSHLGKFKVGEVVRANLGYGYVPVEILEVDDHPFEYAELRVRMIDSVALPAPELWISSRHVERKGE